MGVRQKILVVLASVLIVTLGISIWLFDLGQQQRNMARQHHHGQQAARLLARALSYPGGTRHAQHARALVNEIVASPDFNFARVTDHNGKIVATSGHPPEDETLNIEQPILHQQHHVVGYLTLGLDTAALAQHHAASLSHNLQQAGVLVLLVTAAGFLLLSFFVIRPMRRITRSIQNSTKSGSHDMEFIPLAANDEFARLSQEFNHMSRKLSETNHQLQIKAEAADQQLIRTNRRLVEQSEQLRITNQELQQLSITDALTNVYNRRYFDQQLHNEVEVANRYHESCSLLLIDLDHFKGVNDQYGHQAGDIILREVAQMLQKNLRQTDLLCRCGGEEFAAICKHTDHDSGLQLAEKLRLSVSKLTQTIEQQQICVTISIGIATIPDSAASPADKGKFYLAADRALYYSKAHGRDQVTHCDDIPGGPGTISVLPQRN